MAALQAGPVLRAVKNILLGLQIPQEGIYALPTLAFGEVNIGRRLSATRALAASVLIQPNDTREPVLGIYQWDFTIIVEMFYRVATSIETSEIMLADAYPAAVHEFYENRRLVDPASGLPTVASSKVSGPSSNPWYEDLSSVEYRLQVIFLNCWLRNPYDTNQPTVAV